MEDNKIAIINHIKKRLSSLEELGKMYSEEKINKLAEQLLSTNKPLDTIFEQIDNKFSNQVRKINHNEYLSSLKEYYISSIESLKKGNNCYLLSYQKGVKILEQAFIENIKEISPFITLVNLNNEKKALQYANSQDNDYELIMSDIAYLLNVTYAKTYRIFDKDMNPIGIISETVNSKNERFLNLEETLRFIKEESSNFSLKSKVVEYHDQNIKNGLSCINDKKQYKENIEYVLNLFKALPDITEKNYKKLKKDYLNMKIFELLTNSLNNNLNNVGIIINKESLKYCYSIAPSFNKNTINIPTIKDNQTICNFFIVEKQELLHTIVVNYYKEVKGLLSLIVINHETLIPLIDQIIKEHLSFEEYNNYYNTIVNNVDMIIKETTYKKAVSPDSEEDEELYNHNNSLYDKRIAPFLENYIVEEEDDEKGSAALIVIASVILIVVILIILGTLYAISKVEM